MYDTIQKTLAAWAFNHYIAYYYFDNVNVNQLKVAFEKGEVELENLPIKKDALQHFNFPVEVVSGIVGRLSIKVPLMTLLTDPWVIKINNIMLIVAPRKQVNIVNGNASTSMADETFPSSMSDQSHLDLIQDTSDANLADYLDNSSLDFNADQGVNSEETKLAEFYSSFSATVSAIVRDIYKNIRLEVESMTILFEDFDHGLVKLNIDSLLLHRPKSLRNIIMDNVSIHLSGVGVSGMNKNDLLKLHFEKCNLDIHDEASNNLQLVLVQQPGSGTHSSASAMAPPVTTSETKIEGYFKVVSIKLIKSSYKRSGGASSLPIGKDKQSNEESTSRNILNSDLLKVELKLSNNIDDGSIKLSEKNLHIKLDLVGMQYIHSQRIYELTTQRLMNLLKFIVKLQTKKSHDQSQFMSTRVISDDSFERHETSFNKLLIINIEEGLIYIVDDTSGPCAIPQLEFSLEDCRILQFSGKHQQNGFVFAKIGCSYFNSEISDWDTLLKPWPFNLSWDFKSGSMIGHADRLVEHKQISLNSDETAEFVLSSAFLDMGDIALKRLIDDFIHPKLWPLANTLNPNSQSLSQNFDSLFVLHNETGYKLTFLPLEANSELLDIHELSSSSSPSLGPSGDIHKLSVYSRSSISSRESPDLNFSFKWTAVDVGETVSFQFETLPIYRRHISDLNARSRVLLVRVEGWKTLAPIPIDKTGLFFRQAYSDRIMNEDTNIAICINLEEGSARKVVSIRSPLNLINSLDATLEVHFVESNQALYIKPDSHLVVPLPYLYNSIHIRPCNVGVTMSEQALLWDNIKQISDAESEIHICHPITITDLRHASYCTSQPYRICISTKREKSKYINPSGETLLCDSLPVFTMSFLPPLTIVNLLPCQLQYSIGDIDGTLNTGIQQRIYHVDTTKVAYVYFKIDGFPSSKAIIVDPGATGSFHHTLEMLDKKNRSLFLKAKIILDSEGEKPAIKIVVYSQYWFINNTRQPLIFKQEGAALEAAGQFREHEESAVSTLLFSFYDTEIEMPWLCSMRLGKSKGSSIWCEGFKLEKGNGERRLCFTNDKDSKLNKSLIDINIKRGYGRYSDTMIVTFTARYGFNPLTKTPRKTSMPSPQNYKLTSYNHNANLAEKIAGQAVSLFNNHYKGATDISINVPGLKLTLIDNLREKLIEASIESVVLKCNTNAKEQIMDCSIQNIRIDNVMQECEKGVMLDRVPNLDESMNLKPALRIIMDRILGNSFGTTLFRQVQISMCEIALNIEEKLILKLVKFISFRNRRQLKNMNNLSYDLEKILHPEDDRLSKYYFDLLRIDLSSLKLSVFTSTNLSSSLQKLKAYLGLKFFSFEDAQLQLAPYIKMHVSRTFKGMFDSITRFYRHQILEQAPRIVGQQIQNYLRFHLSDLLSTLYDEVYNKLFN